jgi:hypothetical protein
MIELVSRRLRVQWHLHRCPICKKIRHEPNEVCGKSSGDHVFACLECLQDYRLRLGTDVLIDTYLDQTQLDRLQQFAPSEHANMLDLLDKFRQEQQLAALAEKAKNAPPIDTPGSEALAEQKAKADKENKERVYDEAEKLTWDEARAELEKIQKEEEI